MELRNVMKPISVSSPENDAQLRSFPLSLLLCLSGSSEIKRLKSRTVCIVIAKITHSSMGKATWQPTELSRPRLQPLQALLSTHRGLLKHRGRSAGVVGCPDTSARSAHSWKSAR